MKVMIDWDEKYPELFLDFPGDDLSAHSRSQLEKYGTEVPDVLAERWRAVRDAWRSLDDEVRAFTGRKD